MNSFFEKAIEKSLDVKSLNRTVIIIPNRRSRIFLKQAIQSKLNKISISPEIYSIDDFIERIADNKETEKTAILFYLYESYMQISKKNDFENYNSFRKWANIFLKDLNDIQMSNNNHQDVLNYLLEIKKINAINEEDEFKLEFWKILPKISEIFIEKLRQNNCANKGLIHLDAEKNIELYSNAHKNYNFLILGLNSLSNIEAYIIEYLLSNNKAQIFWDCDESFTNNTINQSGYFFRKYKNSWDHYKSNIFDFEHNELSEKKIIDIYPATKNVNQVNIVSNIISDLKGKTAIILPNQDLVLPMLNAIPKKVKSYNLSLSFPMAEMPLFKFFNLFFELYGGRGGSSFYFRDVLKIIENNIFNTIFQEEKDIEIFNLKIKTLNITYLSKKFIESLKLSQIDRFFRMTNKTVIDELLGFTDLCEDKLNMDIYYDQLISLRKILFIIQKFQISYGFDISFRSLKEIFNDILKNQSINLYGDLNADIQIMGLLESRSLEFENVIFCSANDGILPNNNFTNSLLTYDLRKKFEIPTIDEADAREAYDFYRLLFKAKNISLIYNSVSEGVSSSEKSRFIYQLELLKKDNHKINYFNAQFEIPKKEAFNYSFDKSKGVIKKLKDIADSGFSPSSLTTYIENPLTFFDNYLLKTDEYKNVIENPEALGIGRIFHNSMQDLYNPLVGQILDENKLKGLKKNHEKVINNRFEQEYGKSFKRGKNLIAFDVLKMAIIALIDLDIKKIKNGIEIKLISVEDQISTSFITKKSKIKYKLKGFIDRIQTENGHTKIIDYKTGGSITSSSLSFEEFDQVTEKKKKELFQLLCYSLIYLESNKKIKSVEPGLILLKSIKSGTNVVRKKLSHRKYDSIFDLKNLSEFKLLVDGLVEEIFDKNLNFESN